MHFVKVLEKFFHENVMIHNKSSGNESTLFGLESMCKLTVLPRENYDFAQ